MSTITVSEQVTPNAPSAGKMAIYYKADGLFYMKNAAGVETIFNAANLTAALALKIDAATMGVANGVATLDAGSKIPVAQLPLVAITNTFPVASQAAQVALTAQVGDVAIRSDQNLSYILMADPAATFTNWLVLASPTDSVTSVAGKTGVVTLAKDDVGLGNVDNTSDATKQTASNALLAGGTLPISATTLSATGSISAIGNGSQIVANGYTSTATSPTFTWGGQESTTGMFLPAGNVVAFATGGVERGRFSPTGLAVTGALTTAGIKEDATGNLGLGVVPKAWASSIKALDFGSAGALYAVSDTNLINNGYIDSASAWRYKNTQGATYYNQYAGAHKWFSAPSGTAGAAITFTQAMTLDASGALLNPAMYAVTTASASNAFIDTNGQIKRSTSTAALKTDIEDMDPVLALRLVELFRAVWYRSLCPEDKAEWSWFGGIAEEVALIDPRFVHYGYLESDYEMITVDDGEVEEQISDTVLVDRTDIELVAGVPTQVIKQVETSIPRVTITQVVDLEGNPVIRTDITKDEAGNDIITQIPITYPVPVTRLVAKSHQEKKLKPTAVLVPIGLQYERFTVPLMLVAKMQEARIVALEAKP